MDGQQRTSALKEFYSGEFKLSGLEIWPELNGRTYSSLPSQIRQGLDRRSISYVVVLKESSEDSDSATFLQQTVFERLNTGGVKLERQEIRNCLFQGGFNNLLLDLSSDKVLREAWGIPVIQGEEPEDPRLLENNDYKKMKDAELVLRFFALRHANYYTRGMQGFLDLYMSRAQHFRSDDLSFLGELFKSTLDTAHKIYGEQLFRPFDAKSDAWLAKPSKALYDAEMVAIAEILPYRETLIENRRRIVSSTKDLFRGNPIGTFTGQGNSKTDILNRISKFSDMLADHC